MPEPVRAPNLSGLEAFEHGFGLRDTDPPEGIRTVRHIHSARVGDAIDASFTEGDALVSRGGDLLVGIRTADCVPVLLADPETKAFAAIHAGWRGTAENIAASAVLDLVRRYGVAPGNLRAAIGPSIGVCCYQVGADVAHRFGSWIPELANVGAAVHLDLRAINELQLRLAGVQNVWVSGECTFCAPNRFFSYRREQEQAGRMLSYIGMPIKQRANR